MNPNLQPTQPLYVALGRLLQRAKHATDPATRDLIDSELTRLGNAFLPSGSGFDAGCEILSRSSPKRILIQTGFHHMDEGMYTKWTHHLVTVTPDWVGFDVKVSGPNHREIKDYIGDAFYHALTEEVPINAQAFVNHRQIEQEKRA